MKYLVETKSIEIDATDQDGVTPLMIAVEKNMAEAAFYLIDKGARVDLRDKDINTLLHRAAESGALVNLMNLLDTSG